MIMHAISASEISLFEGSLLTLEYHHLSIGYDCSAIISYCIFSFLEHYSHTHLNLFLYSLKPFLKPSSNALQHISEISGVHLIKYRHLLQALLLPFVSLAIRSIDFLSASGLRMNSISVLNIFSLLQHTSDSSLKSIFLSSLSVKSPICR